MNNLSKNDARILLVEDEESLAIGLKYNLAAEGYEVDWVADGRKALDYIGSHRYDLILLDIMLPYIDGFEVARQIRLKDPQMPILILTARTGIKDRIRGLETGADDYLAKPFHLKELMLRVKGMLKRKTWYRKLAAEIPVFRFGGCEVNFEKLSCICGEKTYQLTVREAMILRYMISNKDKIITRKALLENVWNLSGDIETRTIDNFIARLRKYIEPDPSNPVYIRSVRGSGYIFSDGN